MLAQKSPVPSLTLHINDAFNSLYIQDITSYRAQLIEDYQLRFLLVYYLKTRSYWLHNLSIKKFNGFYFIKLACVAGKSQKSFIPLLTPIKTKTFNCLTEIQQNLHRIKGYLASFAIAKNKLKKPIKSESLISSAKSFKSSKSFNNTKYLLKAIVNMFLIKQEIYTKASIIMPKTSYDEIEEVQYALYKKQKQVLKLIKSISQLKAKNRVHKPVVRLASFLIPIRLNNQVKMDQKRKFSTLNETEKSELLDVIVTYNSNLASKISKITLSSGKVKYSPSYPFLLVNAITPIKPQFSLVPKLLTEKFHQFPKSSIMVKILQKNRVEVSHNKHSQLPIKIPQMYKHFSQIVRKWFLYILYINKKFFIKRKKHKNWKHVINAWILKWGHKNRFKRNIIRRLSVFSHVIIGAERLTNATCFFSFTLAHWQATDYVALKGIYAFERHRSRSFFIPLISSTHYSLSKAAPSILTDYLRTSLAKAIKHIPILNALDSAVRYWLCYFDSTRIYPDVLCQGVKIEVRGKIDGADRKRTWRVNVGPISTSTFSSNIRYEQSQVITRYGSLHIHVWLYYADIVAPLSLEDQLGLN